MAVWLEGAPSTGLRVLDVSTILAGPLCCQILGDFGSEVIKVEHPKGTWRGMTRGRGMFQSARLRAGARFGAWGVWAACAALTAVSLWLLALNGSGGPRFSYWLEDTVIALAAGSVGAVIFARRPQHPIGWLFCAAGLVAALDHFVAQYAIHALRTDPGALPGGEVAAWIRSWLWVSHLGLFVLLGLLFPDGRFASPRWRRLGQLTWTAVAVGAVWVAFAPGDIDGLAPLQNPRGVEWMWPGSDVAVATVEVVLFLFALAAARSLVLRLRRATGRERRQLKWFVFAGALTAVGALLAYTISEIFTSPWIQHLTVATVVIGLCGLPLAVAVAVLRDHLYDIDHLVNRTAVYALVTAVLGWLYALTAMLSASLLGFTSDLPVAGATLLAAAAFGPVRRRAQTFVDRRFDRSRYDAARTVEAFAGRLRDEVELGALSQDLQALVVSVLHPRSVSLWVSAQPEAELGRAGSA